MEKTDNKTTNNKPDYNRKNVNNIKKMIIMTFLIMFFVPMVICIFLFIRMNKLETKLDKLMNLVSAKEANVLLSDNDNVASQDLAQLDNEAFDDVEKNTAHEQGYLSNPEELLQPDGEQTVVSNGKKVYLTFDDGPGKNTERLLDILKENGVKATFFVCYNPDEESWPMYSRIVDEGHTIGMHSYSHKYREIYADKDSFIEDVTLIHDFIEELTGVDTRFYRFPGGSSNTVSRVDIQELMDFLSDNNITYYDWNALSGDAVDDVVSEEELIENVLEYVRANEGDSMVLMHDLTGVPETVDGLDELIKILKSEGYELCPIDEDTVPVQHVKHNGKR